MDTQVRTPNSIFMQPQRLLVPLFQRPYVWNQERQWEPLWRDLVRVAERSLAAPHAAQPHFLGAIVLQQVPSVTSDLQQRSVIDGQQRLTTLQVMLDAIHAEIHESGQTAPASRLLMLVENPESYRSKPEDQYKVWPTNRDRDAFNEVMAAPTPVDYAGLTHKQHRLVEAHRFFAEECRDWLRSQGDEAVPTRADCLERAARELLQLVVIDLAETENAQEIFETLNARGTPLTAADLIKNFVFQRLLEQEADVEKSYRDHWRQFETSFWEREINLGRTRSPRSSAFLWQWLVSETGEEISPKEVFTRFKVHAEFENKRPMQELLQEIYKSCGIYKEFVDEASKTEGDLSRLALFVYRTQAMEIETVKPLLLTLLNHPIDPIPSAELDRVLDTLESWLARRMLVKATTSSYPAVMAALVNMMRRTSPDEMATTVEDYLRNQSSESAYWPDDAAVRDALTTMPIYRRLSRGRLRMVLEAIEDHLRGWGSAKGSLAAMRVPRNTFHIEHLMPRNWHASWPLPEGMEEYERDLHVHRLGNLTLLSQRLNSKVSNGPWSGSKGKVAKLKENDVLLMNARIVDERPDAWHEEHIRSRTAAMIDTLLNVWAVPEGHRTRLVDERKTSIHSIDLVDLLSEGVIEVGQKLYARQGKHAGSTAEILPDGQVELNGKAYTSLSAAGRAATKQSKNGWYFWCIDPEGETSLRDVRRQYVDSLGIDEADDVEEDAGEA
jgi:hypothetical protein